MSDRNPFLYLLREKGNVRVIPGGRVFWLPVRYQGNQFVQRIDPTEEILLGINPTLTDLEYSAKAIVVPTMISDFEMAQNQGEDAFLNLYSEREDTSEASLMNAVEEDLQGDGTGYAGKAFAGIRAYVSKTPSSGSYGGLSRVTYPAIKNTAVEAVATFGSATDASNIESRIRSLVFDLTMKTGPDIGLAGRNFYAYGADSQAAKQRFTQNQKMYEAGFANYMIEGVTMVLANGKQFSGLPRIGANEVYTLRSEDFALYMYRGYNFQPVKKQSAMNQLVDVGLTVGFGNLVCRSAALSGVLWDNI